MATDKTTIPVHATPKAAKNRVVGVKRDAAGRSEVQVQVTAPPEGGKANKAVCETIAKAVGIPKTSVRVTRGETSRHKIVEVSGNAEKVLTWIDSLRD